MVLGLFAFTILLAFHNITDGDLWAKLAIGASVWQGHFMRHDVFAFTQTLPQYIDHEWGAGFVFYSLLKMFGPQALMALKIILAIGALGFALLTGRKQGCDVNILLLLAIPAAVCILPAYIPVLRSHTFTYCWFAATLFCVEELRDKRRWPLAALPLMMLLWANLHGGFVVGLGVVFLYAAAAIFWQKEMAVPMAGTAATCVAVTFINPYGVRFWRYLIPALLNPRAGIAEWQPLPLLAWDDFLGFRVFFVLTVAAVALGWKHVSSRKNFQGLAVLAVTAFMGWRSRRHGPFFGVAALAFAGPYYAAVLRPKFIGVRAVGVLYLGLAIFVALDFAPKLSWQILAPIGEDPVREADILKRAGAKGNLATPFSWGSYLSWRLYPNIKVSMDGRYETVYPESTFKLNADFFDHQGDDWWQLCRSYKVDYVILDLSRGRLRPEDLIAKGYTLIWKQDNLSALLCLPEHAAALSEAARTLPPFTVDPLNLQARPLPQFQNNRGT